MYGLFESNHIYRKIILSSVNDRVIAAYNEYKKKKKSEITFKASNMTMYGSA